MFHKSYNTVGFITGTRWKRNISCILYYCCGWRGWQQEHTC